MNAESKKTLDYYLKSIEILYEDIKSWLRSSELITSEETIEIIEEASGKYQTEKLIIQDSKNSIIASIVPIGAWVIGANGRVDLIGEYDKEILVNIEKSGPSIATTINVDDHKESSSTQFYKGVIKTGWYWIENRRRGKVYLLNKELLYELLSEVSDYEF